jgi:hypothetical protein
MGLRTTQVLDTARLHKVVHRTSTDRGAVVRRVSCALVWLRPRCITVYYALLYGLVRTRSTPSLVVGAYRSLRTRSRPPRLVHCSPLGAWGFWTFFLDET